MTRVSRADVVDVQVLVMWKLMVLMVSWQEAINDDPTPWAEGVCARHPITSMSYETSDGEHVQCF